MNTEPSHPGPVTRQTFLKEMAVAAAAIGLRGFEIPGLTARAPDSALSARQGANVTVDLSRVTGKTVRPHLYGYATGALLDDDFRLSANSAAESSGKTLAPSLLRFDTSAGTLIQTVFAKGVSRPDWTPFSRWVHHRGDFLRAGGRLVFGIGPGGGDTSLSPATWAKYARATALYFRRIGQEITYWEVGNECDPMGAVVYSRYFNAIADALHSVNPDSVVGGPVASWWNGIDLPTFAEHSGTRLGFIDFHSYPVGRTDSKQSIYEKAASFSDVRKARMALAGTAAASLPIGLLEYNMNGGRQPDGKYGIAAQGTITGAVYAALLLAQAFTSDPRFTMGALWDLVADSNFGVIGNAQRKGSYHAIDQQGWYLRQAARLMPGQQVPAATTTPGLQVLATRNGRRFSIQLVNYSVRKEQAVTIGIKGAAGHSKVTRWELSDRYPNGRASAASLPRTLLPPESIIILNG